VPVRGGWRDWRSWPWRRIAPAAAALLATLGAYSLAANLIHDSERFRLAPGESGLIVTGTHLLDPQPLRRAFAEDEGASLAEIPLAERQAAVAAAPWVRKARVVRLWPDRIWVDVVERTPVAHVRVPGAGAGRLETKWIDSDGVFLDPIPGAEFELPVLDGIDRSQDQGERRRRVELFERMMAELDSKEPHFSERISQVDVSDPKNVKAIVVVDGDVIELALGDKLFRHRFEVFDAYIDGWIRQYGSVASVDLTLKEQVVIQPLAELSQTRPN